MRQLAEIVGLLESKLSGYFSGFDEISGARGWKEAGFCPYSSSDYIASLADYIEKHASSHASMRSTMAFEAAEGLKVSEALCHTMLIGDDGILPCLQEFQLHFRLRDFLAASLKQNMNSPESNTVYMWSDFAEPLW